jgi:hypothetical protein
MTQPPTGYPAPDPSRREPPPAGRFREPPGWDQPTQPVQPRWAGAPASAGPPGPGSPYQPPGHPAHHAAGSPPGQPPRRRRRLPLVAALVLAGVLVLSAGGGVAAWLLTRDGDQDGAETPAGAVQSFLQAVYRDLDPAAAASVVCSEARDEGSLRAKIDDIRSYAETELNPSFSWSEPALVEQTGELATLAVTVTMTTGDEQTAQQTLHVRVLDKAPHGWWVCDLETVTAPETQGGDGATPTPGESDQPGGE